MANFNPDILAFHGPVKPVGGAVGSVVVVKQVLGDPGTLRFPVTPEAHCTVVKMVAPVDNIDGGVHLDPGDFSPGQLLHVVNVVDVVVFN